MYKLTLSLSDRKAIDWVGYRYSHGTDLYKQLVECEWDEDWDYDGDITYNVPEPVAWEMSKLIEQDSLACFGPELCEKLRTFQIRIV